MVCLGEKFKVLTIIYKTCCDWTSSVCFLPFSLPYASAEPDCFLYLVHYSHKNITCTTISWYETVCRTLSYSLLQALHIITSCVSTRLVRLLSYVSLQHPVLPLLLLIFHNKDYYSLLQCFFCFTLNSLKTEVMLPIFLSHFSEPATVPNTGYLPNKHVLN